MMNSSPFFPSPQVSAPRLIANESETTLTLYRANNLAIDFFYQGQALEIHPHNQETGDPQPIDHLKFSDVEYQALKKFVALTSR